MHAHSLIPPPAFASGTYGARVLPNSKHCRGRNQKRIMGGPAPSTYAPGRQAELRLRAAAKADLLASSSAEANHLAKERQDRRTYEAWFLTLSAADQAFARARGIDRYQSDRTRPAAPQSSEDALDAADRDPIPEAMQRGSHNGRPIVALENPCIDAMEPEDLSVEIAHLSPDEIEQAGETFGHALRWALDPSPHSTLHTSYLVTLGHRAAVLIATMHTDLALGLPVDSAIARSLLESFRDFRLKETLTRLQSTGVVYARILEWLRRATSISGLGERLQLVAYQFRSDLLDAATLAELGEATNKTRQAKNKGSNCLRDTFAGLAALVQRPDITRLRCRAAQLA